MTIDLANILDTRLSSQNTRNGISGHQVFKIFWASNPLYPLGACALGTRGIHLVIKKYLHTQKVGQSGISDHSFRRGGEHMKVEVHFQFV